MNPRKLAYEAINKVMAEQAYANLTVNEYLSRHRLNDNDRRLFTRLVYGTVENYLKLEYLLKPFLKKKPDPFIHSLLCMSVYQIEYTGIPAFAAVDEAVKIAKEENRFAASFVNAVLRNYLRAGKRDLSALPENEWLSINYSHPLWLVDYLLSLYDRETTEKILRENNESKLLAIRVNTLKATVAEVEAELAKDGIGFRRIPLVKMGLMIDGDLHDHRLVREGKVVFQDGAAQLVAEMMAPERNAKIIDLCAGPGGKTAHLAAIMKNSGVIYACDVHPHKIALMDKLFARLGVKNVKTVLADATKIKDAIKDKDFDYVLADVPCSGLGAVSDRIDLKYRITREVIDELVALQRNILDRTWDLLKPGGKYVYSTCTINPAENEDQIKAFVKRNPDARIVNEKLIMPYEYHTDGFYICIMEKRVEE
jgi:16S rRNA (cytosine967-C5)-methyltransferase